MESPDKTDLAGIRARIRHQVHEDRLRITAHAHQEMGEDDVSLDELCEVLLDAEIVENYPEHERGSCCLMCGKTAAGRHLHAVCTTALDVTVIITVYEPKPPRWTTPFQRGGRQ
jgi:hypothetical protein